jgi:hypothetical protein
MVDEARGGVGESPGLSDGVSHSTVLSLSVVTRDHVLLLRRP